MSGDPILEACGDDAGKWAAEYMRRFGDEKPTEDNLIGWFANAIEHSSDVRRWRRERAARSTPLQVSDLVRLTPGGPRMRVESIDIEHEVCTVSWGHQTAEFSTAWLERAT